jgi:hypothetical protein
MLRRWWNSGRYKACMAQEIINRGMDFLIEMADRVLEENSDLEDA